MAGLPSYFTDETKRFVNQFNQRVEQIVSHCLNQKGNSEFFNRSRKSPGFLNILLDTFNGLGFPQISRFVTPSLSANRDLPLHEFAKGIAHLHLDELDQLSKLKSIVYENENKESHSEALRILEAALTSAKDSSSDSAEASRLIITLSTIAEEFIQLKECLSDFNHVIQKAEEISINLENSPEDHRYWYNVDQIMPSLDYLLESLNTDSFPFNDSRNFISNIFQLKRNLIHTIIEKSLTERELPGNHLHIMHRNLKTWIDYELIQKSDQKDSLNIEEDFSEQFVAFKDRIQQKLQLISTLNSELQSSAEAKHKVSHQFISILKDFNNLINKILTLNINIDRKFRGELRQIAESIEKTGQTLNQLNQKDQNELKQFPDLLRQPLQYFNSEVPSVILRSNPKEIKYMTLAFESSFKNLNIQLKKSIGQLVDQNDFERISEMIRVRYCDILNRTVGILGSVQVKGKEAVVL